MLNCGIFQNQIVNGLLDEERYEEMASRGIDTPADIRMLSKQILEMDR
jgi:hypothetical protein